MGNKVYQSIRDLCTLNGITISELEKELNMGKGTVSKWKTRSPSSDTIVKIAEYFKVSTDRVMGVVPINEESDPDILCIQRARSSMSQAEKDKMMSLLKMIFNDKFKDGE